MSAPNENVLVVRRELFDRMGSFQGLHRDASRYLDEFLKRENNFFSPRATAETDPSLKQIIPYAVFTHEGRVLHYVRGGGGGEKRLVAKGSIGIGGHINDSDETLFASFDADAYHNAVRREIAEELKITGGWEERIVALINDDSTDVGSVHLGVVHVVSLEFPEVKAGEKAIRALEFLTPAELRERMSTLETWSQIILSAWEEL
jgi:predicted NUDIX family phosphoesterase